jgi:hypothetical protein
MAVDANENELSVWGFTKGLRTGLITFILALLITAVIYLYVDKAKSEARAEEKQRLSEAQKLQMQKELYEQMIEYLKPTKDRMNTVADKVDTAVTRAINSADRVDSLTNSNNQSKPLKR